MCSAPGKRAALRCSDNLCVEATCYVHDSRVYVLNVSYPAIKSACTKYKFCTDSITQWNNVFIAVHTGQTRAADTVELDTFSTDSFAFSKYSSEAPIVQIWDTNVGK